MYVDIYFCPIRLKSGRRAVSRLFKLWTLKAKPPTLKTRPARTLKIQRTACYSRVSGCRSAQLAHHVKSAFSSAWHASGCIWEELTQKTLAPPLGQKKNRNSGLRHLMIYMRVSNERNLLLITFVINNNNNLIIMKYYDYYEILYVIQYEGNS